MHARVCVYDLLANRYMFFIKYREFERGMLIKAQLVLIISPRHFLLIAWMTNDK